MVASGTFESSSGVVLDVLTEASNAETVFTNHMDRNCQVLFYLMCYIWKDVFQLCAKMYKEQSRSLSLWQEGVIITDLKAE